MQLSLIIRSYCHLCDEMRVAVQAALQDSALEGTAHLSEIDLDEHPALEERYSEWVPVLLLGSAESGMEICHYHFDRNKWNAATGLAISRAIAADS